MNTQPDSTALKTPAQRALPFAIVGGLAGGIVMMLMLNSPDVLKSIFFCVFGGLIWGRIGFATMHFLFRKVLK